MFAIMSTLHLKDNGDLHVLELASIPNKCMQYCLFLKKPALRCLFCVGFPSTLTQKMTSEVYVIFSLCGSQLMKIMQNDDEFCNAQLSSSSEVSVVFKLIQLKSIAVVIVSDSTRIL